MRLSQERSKRIEVPNDPDQGYVTIIALSDDQIAKLESKNSDVRVNDKNEAEMTLDGYGLTTAIALACTVGWGNMFDEKGKELKFNSRNILRVANLTLKVDDEKIRFLAWIENEHNAFRDEVIAEEEEARKNG